MSSVERSQSVSEYSRHADDLVWVILYGSVWDGTSFLPEHPGGSSIILKLAGKDATEEYDPIHPPGTLEENLPQDARLGAIDPASLPEPVKSIRLPESGYQSRLKRT